MFLGPIHVVGSARCCMQTAYASLRTLQTRLFILILQACWWAAYYRHTIGKRGPLTCHRMLVGLWRVDMSIQLLCPHSLIDFQQATPSSFSPTNGWFSVYRPQHPCEWGLGMEFLNKLWFSIFLCYTSFIFIHIFSTPKLSKSVQKIGINKQFNLFF